MVETHLRDRALCTQGWKLSSGQGNPYTQWDWRKILIQLQYLGGVQGWGGGLSKLWLYSWIIFLVELTYDGDHCPGYSVPRQSSLLLDEALCTEDYHWSVEKTISSTQVFCLLPGELTDEGLFLRVLWPLSLFWAPCTYFQPSGQGMQG